MTAREYIAAYSATAEACEMEAIEADEASHMTRTWDRSESDTCDKFIGDCFESALIEWCDWTCLSDEDQRRLAVVSLIEFRAALGVESPPICRHCWLPREMHHEPETYAPQCRKLQ